MTNGLNNELLNLYLNLNHDGVMVGRTETANSDGRVWGCACAYMRECA